MKMNHEILKSKKITLATVKSFVKNVPAIYVEHKSSFSGMSDMVEYHSETRMIEISKEKALGINGAYVVGRSRDYFRYMESETHYGIKIYNACGSAILWAKK
jgi:hypothetical protein